MCEKFHYDWLRNDRALGNGKYDNNNNTHKNNVGSAWGLVSGSKKRSINSSRQSGGGITNYGRVILYG